MKFDLQKDEVERTATADIEARAFTRVRGDGTRGIEIPKEFGFISNSGREWVCSAVGLRSRATGVARLENSFS